MKKLFVCSLMLCGSSALAPTQTRTDFARGPQYFKSLPASFPRHGSPAGSGFVAPFAAGNTRKFHFDSARPLEPLAGPDLGKYYETHGYAAPGRKLFRFKRAPAR